MSDLIEYTLHMLCFLAVIMIAFVVLVGGITIACIGFEYWFDNSSYSYFVEGKKVYEGRCFFTSLESIGENGNTKKLKIYSEVPPFKTIQTYVNEDIKAEK